MDEKDQKIAELEDKVKTLEAKVEYWEDVAQSANLRNSELLRLIGEHLDAIRQITNGK